MGVLVSVAVALYLLIGLVQLFAIVTGIQAWWGLHWIVSAPVAFFLAYIPVLGTLTGIAGAVGAWS